MLRAGATTASCRRWACAWANWDSPTRVLAVRCGAPFSYAATGEGEPLAPGQLSFREMRSLYRCERIEPATEVYGVIGDPDRPQPQPAGPQRGISRSAGLDAVYVPFRVPPDDLLSFLDDAPELGIKGLSVTIPHKEGMLARVTDRIRRCGPSARRIRLVWKESRRLRYNTDQQAAIDSLAAAQPGRRPPISMAAWRWCWAPAARPRRSPWSATSRSRRGRSAADARASAGTGRCRWVAGRSPGTLGTMARRNLIVNCTPLGMSPKVDATPFEAPALRTWMIVFDTVYNPEQTRLLARAQAAGCTVVSGVEMFVRQAARQFELFTGQECPAGISCATPCGSNPGA